MTINYASDFMNNIFENGKERPEYLEARLKAEEILNVNGLKTSNHIDIVKLARKYGFFVATATLPSQVQGMFFFDESGEKKYFGTNYSKLIVVEDNLTTEQKRFVVAHELGHYFIDRGVVPCGEHLELRVDNHNKLAKENVFDYFAACILMPSDMVKAMISNMNITDSNSRCALVERLSNIFRVSQIVASRRIDEVNALMNSIAL